MLGREPVDVLDEATVDGGRRGHAGEDSQPTRALIGRATDVPGLSVA
jgi:hypothetical protein